MEDIPKDKEDAMKQAAHLRSVGLHTAAYELMKMWHFLYGDEK